MKTQNRPLTQEELEMAWSLNWKPTHYHVNKEKGVLFANDNMFTYVRSNSKEVGVVFGRDCDINEIEPYSPIPQKPFNIKSNYGS